MPLQHNALTRSSTLRVETPLDTCLLDHGQEGPFAATPWLQQRGEVAAIADLRLCGSMVPTLVSQLRVR